MSGILKTCDNCGGHVPPDAPANLCPGCLIRGGLTSEGGLCDPQSDSALTLHIAIPEDAPFPNGAPKRLGSYELLEAIAQGGMGVVYRARHTGLDRMVALKMIRSGVLATARDVERFQREARSAAKLHHPNVVTIHDIGEQDGQHYFTMDYVPGENLAERARSRPFSPRQAAEITAGVAAAIHYAHQHGVLHRDIKPANVILTPEQQPRVLDFGLALLVSDESNLTLSGTPVGSPSYMPPEQAAGQSRRTDARSDVYSLGATLYELLTGRPPFQAANSVETLRLVIENEPVPPRRLNPALPRDLETICLKCLEKAPDRRYQTAEELGDELGRFIRDEPIRARAVSQSEKLWRWCRRKPLVASLAATSLALLIAVACGSPVALYHINHARAEQRRLLYAADMNVAQQSVMMNNLGRARRLLDRHRPRTGEEDLRGWEWRYLWQLCQSDAVTVLARRQAPAVSVDFSADGTRLAAGYLDGRVELWDAGTRQLLQELHPGSGGRPARVAFSPRAGILATTAGPGTIKLHDLRNGRATVLWQDTETIVRHLFYSRDGARLAAYLYPKHSVALAVYIHPGKKDSRPGKASIVVFDTRSGKAVSTNTAFGGSEFSGVAAVMSPDHGRLYTGSSNFSTRRCTIQALDLKSGREIWAEEAGRDDGLTALALSPDGTILVSSTGEEATTIKVWNAQTGQFLKELDGHSGWVGDLAFSRDGRRLVSASADQSLRLWDMVSNQELMVLRGHSDEVHSVAFSTDGRMLASGGKDGAIMLWDPAAKRSSSSYQPAADDVMWLEKLGESTGLSYDWQFMKLAVVNFKDLSSTDVPVTLGQDEQFIGCGKGHFFNTHDWKDRLRFYELQGSTPHLLQEVKLEEPLRQDLRQHLVLDYCEARRLAAWTTRSGTLHVLSLDEPAKHLTLNTGLNEIFPAGFSPDGRWLVVSSTERRKLQVWDLANRTMLIEFDAQVTVRVGFANGGSTLAFINQGALPHEVIFCDLTQPERRLVRFPIGAAGRGEPAVSPDGRLVAAPTRQGVFFVFDAQKMERKWELHGHMQSVLGVQFSPDGKRLVSTSASHEAAKIWDAETRQELLTLSGIGSQLWRVAFVENGNSLLIGCKGQLSTWQIWRAPSWEEIEEAERSGRGWAASGEHAKPSANPVQN